MSNINSKRKDLVNAAKIKLENAYTVYTSKKSKKETLREFENYLNYVRQSTKTLDTRIKMSEPFKRCSESWQKLEKIQPEYKKAGIIMSYYRRSDCIRDLASMYVEHIEDKDDDLAMYLKAAYSNYLRFIFKEYHEMAEKYNQLDNAPAESAADMRKERKFDLRELGSDFSLNMLTEAVDGAYAMLEKIKSVSDPTDIMVNKLSTLIDEIKVLHESVARDNHYHDILAEKEKSFIERIEKMEAEIKISSKLKQDIDEIFGTDEAQAEFGQLDPKSPLFEEKNEEELLAIHNTLAEKLKILIDNNK